MEFEADFDGDGLETRTFYSAYFALDITNPDQDPELLWSFSHEDLGLTTSVPWIVRNESGDIQADKEASWYMLVGSGQTGYEGNADQSANLFVVNLRPRGNKVTSGNITGSNSVYNEGLKTA